MHESQLNQLPNWKQRVLDRVKKDGALSGYEFGEGFYKMRI